MNNIKVSIIIPSYKRHEYFFKRAIESCLSQSHENLEVVIVDDNAKLEHSEYRAELSNYVSSVHDSRIVYIQNKGNLGGALSRNVGIENCTGEYITFLDDDDRYLPDKIKKQLYNIIEKKIDGSFTSITILGENDKVKQIRDYKDIELFKDDLLRYHLLNTICYTNSFMFKKSILIEVGGFIKLRSAQEANLLLLLLERNYKIEHDKTNEVVLYREGQECITHGSNKILGTKEYFQIKKKYFKILRFHEKRLMYFKYNFTLARTHFAHKNIIFFYFRINLSFLYCPIECIKSLLRVSKNL